MPLPRDNEIIGVRHDDFEFTQQSPPVDYGPSRLEKPHEIFQGLPSFGGEGSCFSRDGCRSSLGSNKAVSSCATEPGHRPIMVCARA